ncbi:cation diffusion facilitator family transporter [Nitrobacter sp. NHB1]|uniref:cation diffusion facilitator family transporter n=1 Tax=Nitrobacter sp. NHB1 TaxID=3119830 RepID=UPI002FFFE6C7
MKRGSLHDDHSYRDHARHERDHGGHSHGRHSHAGHGHTANFGRAFAIGIGLNAAFVLVEAGYGFVANSTALLADAGHNLSDVLGLLVAWIAAVLSQRPPTPRLTYGLRNTSILAALLNAILLLIACGAILLEAIQRLIHPEPIASLTVIVVAAIGIIVNGITAWLFASGRKTDLNIRGAYLHMMADAGISLGVVVGASVIMATGWLWLDPTMSFVIVAVIVSSTWGLLRESTAMSLAAVPPGIDPDAVRAFLAGHPGVASIHDLHIWPMSTTETALTAHLVMPAGNPGDAFLTETCRELQRRFGIGHATLQVETSADAACALAPDHVV